MLVSELQAIIWIIFIWDYSQCIFEGTYVIIDIVIFNVLILTPSLLPALSPSGPPELPAFYISLKIYQIFKEEMKVSSRGGVLCCDHHNDFYDDTVLEYFNSISLCDMRLDLLLVWGSKKLLDRVSED